VTGCRFSRGGDDGTRHGVCKGCSGLLLAEDGCVERKNRGGLLLLLLLLSATVALDTGR